MISTEILNRIVHYAKQFDGVEEIPGNMGWENKEFQKAMEETGWEEGQAYCAFFVKMVYLRIFNDTIFYPKVEKLFTGSATQTFNNCKKDPSFFTDYHYEIPGTVAVWRKWDNGTPSWKGHIGVVFQRGRGNVGDTFKTIEANTNTDGGREGKEIAIKERINNHGEKDGLVLEGFIFPPIPLDKLEPKKIKL